MNFRTYNDLTNCIVKNLHKIPRDIDLIVGVPRSGTMAGNILALYLNLPFTDLDHFIQHDPLKTGSTRKSSRWIKDISEAQHVLIVDDSISSGQAMGEVKELLSQNNITSKITTLAVYGLALSRGKVDICFETVEQPRMFEWNFMHSWQLKYCCLDIDGVVCEDPSFLQNDDGEKYLDFVNNAPPKFLPTQPVGRFVSSRLGKYREATEAWMEKYNIEYDELILMEGVTASERALSGSHASFKADIYAHCDAILFIESNYEQALEICKLSGKPVFCVENMQMITSDDVLARINNKSRELKVTIKHGIKKVMKMAKKNS